MTQLRKGKCLQSEIALHTHDSLAFKRCRRKWFFSSPFQMHLQPKASIKGSNPNLWFGTGFHFALEDYHGYNRFGDPVKAFEAYVAAHEPEELPAEIDDLIELGHAMLEYYKEWEAEHCKWKTVYRDGVPLVEEKLSLVLEPLSHFVHEGYIYKAFIPSEGQDPLYKCEEEPDKWYTYDEMIAYGAEYKEIVFHGTIDRVVEDQNGLWWLLDYKTAKSVDTGKLALDPQISKYCWAAEQWLEHEIEGMVYVQCTKSPPKAPKMTSKGLSTDKRQKTTHNLYRRAIKEVYGDLNKAPNNVVDFLGELADRETENGNSFIRYDWVPRNEYSKEQTYLNILAEGREILDPNLSLYPNPTRDCAWDCSFRDMCLAMEEGADWKFYLDEFEKRPETMENEVKGWEKRLFRKHKDLYPEEYKTYCQDSTNTFEEFLEELE